MIFHDILVIGGGASGLLAAIIAKDHGADVAIVEGGNRVARKILTTGNGRCNFTNNNINPPYDTFHSSNEGFYTKVLDQLTVEDTINLFYTFGLQLVELERGKMYPQSLQASSVIDILRLNIDERKIPVYLDSKVIDLKKQKQNTFLIETNNENNKLFSANKVLVSCGGAAAPETGSDASIQEILKKLGHKIIKPIPSIVQLKLDYAHLKAISGVRFDALAKVYVNGKMAREDFNEVLFTDYGISGPAILQISRHASVGVEKKQDVKIILDIFPEKTFEEVYEFYVSHFSIFSYRSVFNALTSIIHKKLLPVLLKDCGIDDIHKTCDMLKNSEIKNFCKLLKQWEFKCIDTNGLKFAQTTIGGVDTLDVEDYSLESRLVKNLFFSGEVLDVDGDCGGFNLQWAWSSGYVAGKNISKKV
ncbi:MAG: aminoacetone oxidase family FAD-binding enzyme [Haloplasmataceae bacterium]|jgi:predicted Rossmann fold flavoprotein|nr:aminoacetone oxidase family FAD-binding enzyme [Haloplasmataceae bacterium]